VSGFGLELTATIRDQLADVRSAVSVRLQQRTTRPARARLACREPKISTLPPWAASGEAGHLDVVTLPARSGRAGDVPARRGDRRFARTASDQAVGDFASRLSRCRGLRPVAILEFLPLRTSKDRLRPVLLVRRCMHVARSRSRRPRARGRDSRRATMHRLVLVLQVSVPSATASAWLASTGAKLGMEQGQPRLHRGSPRPRSVNLAFALARVSTSGSSAQSSKADSSEVVPCSQRLAAPADVDDMEDHGEPSELAQSSAPNSIARRVLVARSPGTSRSAHSASCRAGPSRSSGA